MHNWKRILKPDNLFLSAIIRHQKPVLELMRGLINPNSSDSTGKSFLMYAAIEGDTEIVEFLLGMGADPNERADDEATALQYAVKFHRTDVVRILVNHGANPNAIVKDLSPVQLAVYLGHDDIVKLLLKHGVDLNHYTPFQPALHKAVVDCNTELVYLLLKHGADILMLNRAGVSAVGLAISMGNKKITQLFLDHGFDLDHAVDIYGNSALHISLGFHRVEISSLLLDVGANPNLVNDQGLTAVQEVLSNTVKHLFSTDKLEFKDKSSLISAA